jgi:hypothetical protein
MGALPYALHASGILGTTRVKTNSLLWVVPPRQLTKYVPTFYLELQSIINDSKKYVIGGILIFKKPLV